MERGAAFADEVLTLGFAGEMPDQRALGDDLKQLDLRESRPSCLGRQQRGGGESGHFGASAVFTTTGSANTSQRWLVLPRGAAPGSSGMT